MKTSKFLGLVTFMTVLGTTTMFGSNTKDHKNSNSKSQTTEFVVKQNNVNFNSGRNDDKTSKELVNMQKQDQKQNSNCNCSSCKKHKKQTNKCQCSSCKKHNSSKQTVVCGCR